MKGKCRACSSTKETKAKYYMECFTYEPEKNTGYRRNVQEMFEKCVLVISRKK
uniref:Uncharacterized protein n=1 Tax=Octopus bimaculoides TaxID=37653 RepID=A0A0L8G3Z5_OCTBM